MHGKAKSMKLDQQFNIHATIYDEDGGTEGKTSERKGEGKLQATDSVIFNNQNMNMH